MKARRAAVAVAAALVAASLTGEAASVLKGWVEPAGSIAPVRDLTNAAYHVRRAGTPPALNGSDVGWQDVPAMVLDRQEQARGWNGPEDLHGGLKLLWDETGLYFHLEVSEGFHDQSRD